MNVIKQLRGNPGSSPRVLRLLVRRATRRHLRVLCAALSGFLYWSVVAMPVMAQEDAPGPQLPPAPENGELSLAPAKVAVQPIALDDEIRQRLQSVMEATAWFNAPDVAVVDGVVFLSGRAETEEIKKWAGDLARNTQDVVAVANRIEVSEPSAWDFRAARSGLSGLSRDVIRSLPFLVVALLILALSAGAGCLTARRARKLLAGRVRAKLLRGVLAWGLGGGRASSSESATTTRLMKPRRSP